MSGGTSTIRRLPQHVTETVRSTAQAADLASAASQLVLNSLQAGARSILVTADISAWSLTVEDDGCGITAASFPLLGQRSCTSKPTCCRGEALASLAQLSQQISITSRAAGTFETHKKLLSPTNNTPAQQQETRNTHAGVQHSTAPSTTLCPIPRQRQGTTVCLKGFLHNQPVRRNRILQQHAGGTAAATAAPRAGPSTAQQLAAATAARASSSCLQEIKQALFVLLLPHTAVELVLQQAGSSAAVLHMPQDRSLDSCLQQLFQQQPSQQHQHQHSTALLQHIHSQHSQGWQLRGCVLTAPAPALCSQQHQLLYVNSRPASCPVLAQMLRDWFIKHVTASAGQLGPGSTAAGQPPGSSRAPQPGYALLLTCPEASYTTCSTPGGTHIWPDFSSSMRPLLQLLQAVLGPVWGSAPSLWRKAAAEAGTAAAAGGTAGAAAEGTAGRQRGHRAGSSAGSSGSGTAAAGHASRVRPLTAADPSMGPNPGAGFRALAQLQVPAHGLQVSSHTRSLARAKVAADIPAEQDTSAPDHIGAHPPEATGEQHQQHQRPHQHNAARLPRDRPDQPSLTEADWEQDMHSTLAAAAAAAASREGELESRLGYLSAAAPADNSRLAVAEAAASKRFHAYAAEGANGSMLAAASTAENVQERRQDRCGSSGGRSRKHVADAGLLDAMDSLPAEQQLQQLLQQHYAGSGGQGSGHNCSGGSRQRRRSVAAVGRAGSDTMDLLQHISEHAHGSGAGSGGCMGRKLTASAGGDAGLLQQQQRGGEADTSLLLQQLTGYSGGSRRRACSAAEDALGEGLFGDEGMLLVQQQAGCSGGSRRRSRRAAADNLGEELSGDEGLLLLQQQEQQQAGRSGGSRRHSRNTALEADCGHLGMGSCDDEGLLLLQPGQQTGRSGGSRRRSCSAAEEAFNEGLSGDERLLLLHAQAGRSRGSSGGSRRRLPDASEDPVGAGLSSNEELLLLLHQQEQHQQHHTWGGSGIEDGPPRNAVGEAECPLGGERPVAEEIRLLQQLEEQQQATGRSGSSRRQLRNATAEAEGHLGLGLPAEEGLQLLHQLEEQQQHFMGRSGSRRGSRNAAGEAEGHLIGELAEEGLQLLQQLEEQQQLTGRRGSSRRHSRNVAVEAEQVLVLGLPAEEGLEWLGQQQQQLSGRSSGSKRHSSNVAGEADSHLSVELPGEDEWLQQHTRASGGHRRRSRSSDTPAAAAAAAAVDAVGELAAQQGWDESMGLGYAEEAAAVGSGSRKRQRLDRSDSRHTVFQADADWETDAAAAAAAAEGRENAPRLHAGWDSSPLAGAEPGLRSLAQMQGADDAAFGISDLYGGGQVLQRSTYLQYTEADVSGPSLLDDPLQCDGHERQHQHRHQQQEPQSPAQAHLEGRSPLSAWLQQRDEQGLLAGVSPADLTPMGMLTHLGTSSTPLWQQQQQLLSVGDGGVPMPLWGDDGQQQEQMWPASPSFAALQGQHASQPGEVLQCKTEWQQRQDAAAAASPMSVWLQARERQQQQGECEQRHRRDTEQQQQQSLLLAADGGPSPMSVWLQKQERALQQRQQQQQDGGALSPLATTPPHNSPLPAWMHRQQHRAAEAAAEAGDTAAAAFAEGDMDLTIEAVVGDHSPVEVAGPSPSPDPQQQEQQQQHFPQHSTGLSGFLLHEQSPMADAAAAAVVTAAADAAAAVPEAPAAAAEAEGVDEGGLFVGRARAAARLVPVPPFNHPAAAAQSEDTVQQRPQQQYEQLVCDRAEDDIRTAKQEGAMVPQSQQQQGGKQEDGQQQQHGQQQQQEGSQQQQQDGQQQEGRQLQGKHLKQLVQSRLPFKTVNGQLPSAAKKAQAPAGKAAAAAATTQPKGPLKPAWAAEQQPGQENSNAAAAGNAAARPNRIVPDVAAAAAAASAVAVSTTPGSNQKLVLLPAAGLKAAAAAAEVASAAAAFGRQTTAVQHATATPAAAAKSPAAALRSSLKASRQRASSTQQQQQGEGDLASAVPRKRVRFSGIGCSQQGDAAAAEATAMEELGEHGCQPVATSLPQQPAEGQQGGMPGVAGQQQQQQQPGVSSQVGGSHSSQGMWVIQPKQQQQQQQGTASSPDFAAVGVAAGTAAGTAAAPGAPAALGELRDSSDCKGNTVASNCSSNRSSRFFSGIRASSNSSSLPGQPRVPPLTAATKDSSGAASTARTTAAARTAAAAAAVLTLEELAYSMPGLLTPGSVSRQQLQEGTVIAQADTKLVVTRCGPVLLAVDQHAADERVQLEALQAQLQQQQPRSAHQQQQHHHHQQQRLQPQQLGVVAGGGEGQKDAEGAAAAAGRAGGGGERLLSHVLLQPPVQLSLTLQEVRAWQQYQHLVEKWGWRLTLTTTPPAAAAPPSAAAAAAPPSAAAAAAPPSAAAAAAPTVLGAGGVSVGVSQAAVLQQVPVLCGVSLGSVDLQLCLHQLLDTNGSSTQPPPGVLRVLRSKACRTAIMFGDTLSHRQCQELLQQLAATELCFMCAHGRPTTIPLVDVQQLAARLCQWQQRQQLGKSASAAAAAAAPGQPGGSLTQLRAKLLRCCRGFKP